MGQVRFCRDFVVWLCLRQAFHKYPGLFLNPSFLLFSPPSSAIAGTRHNAQIQRTFPIISFTQNNGQTWPPWSTSLQGRTLSDASPEKSGLSLWGESGDSCCPDYLPPLPILNPTAALPPSPGSWMPLPSLIYASYLTPTSIYIQVLSFTS